MKHILCICERYPLSIEKGIEWDISCWHIEYRSICIDPTDDILDRVQYHRVHSISLGDDHIVSELDLIESGMSIGCEIVREVLRIYEADDRVEPHSASHIIHEK